MVAALFGTFQASKRYGSPARRERPAMLESRVGSTRFAG